MASRKLSNLSTNKIKQASITGFVTKNDVKEHKNLDFSSNSANGIAKRPAFSWKTSTANSLDPKKLESSGNKITSFRSQNSSYKVQTPPVSKIETLTIEDNNDSYRSSPVKKRVAHTHVPMELPKSIEEEKNCSQMNGSQDMFGHMDEENDWRNNSSCSEKGTPKKTFLKTPEKNNCRFQTPDSSPFSYSITSSGSENKNKLPEKSENSPILSAKTTPKRTDALRSLKLDQSLVGFLDDISNNPAYRDINNNTEPLQNYEKTYYTEKYISVLEKMSYSFDRIPLFVLEKLPGFKKDVYERLKTVRCNLKKAHNSSWNKENTNISRVKKKIDLESHKKESEVFSHKNKSSTTSNCKINGYKDDQSMKCDNEDFEEFDLSTSLISKKKRNDTRQSSVIEIDSSYNNTLDNSSKQLQTSTAQMNINKMGDFRSSSPMNHGTEYRLPKEQTSTPNGAFSKLVESEQSSASKTKGKFTFKKPRVSSIDNSMENTVPLREAPSSTLDRVKSFTDKLKPLPPPEPVRHVALQNSSVQFQPAHATKEFQRNHCQSENSLQSEDPIDNLQSNYDIDDYDYEDRVMNEIASENAVTSDVINVSESIPSTSRNVERDLSKVELDEDGWPVYRIEDFEDEIPEAQTSSEKEPQVMNIMDHSFSRQKAVKKHKEEMGDFHDGTANDGITGEFDSLNYPHSGVMMEQFREKFGLKSFRPNQLQVINATILQHDCFVLMPTGGGKSLCYQLPAILTTGVTIVISPLKSLILDQVNKLQSLDIPAGHLSGELSQSACEQVYLMLAMKEPGLKLLYVTPEKICSSVKFQNTLDSLYARDKLARFVIDEAHCVSQWGHDFRPDYKKLSVLRERFPKSTIMALTATATPRVRTDILHQLKVPNCKWFLSSFNRPNLKYSVLEKKPKSVVKEIEVLIKRKFPRQSGIVYCLSRKECDTTASELKSAGISAASYHAGLTDVQREFVQTSWIADRFKVICATIAFGMGVDKADVRFVIHHSLPKSLEGYYQEAGRAGRDGELAECILYYSYSDVARYRKLLDMDRTSNPVAKRVHIENLLRIVDLCENVTECRRAQVLAYLGERFSREQCLQRPDTACDNCLRNDEYKLVDVTEDCKAIVRCVKEVGLGRHTVLQIADVLRGSVQQRIAHFKNHPAHGRCKAWSRTDPQRLLRQMVVRGLLAEQMVITNEIPNAYLILGPNVHNLMQNNLRIVFPMKSEKSKVTVSSSSSVNPVDTPLNAKLRAIEDRCYADLVEACREIAAMRGASLTAVMQVAALKAMSSRLPECAADMLSLPHVTKANFDKYGSGLLRITSQYAIEKMGLLMEHEDEMEAKAGSDSDTDWAGEARAAGEANTSRGYKRKAPRKGGVRKRFKRAARSTANKTGAGAGRGTGRGSGRGRGRGTGRGRGAAGGFSSPKWRGSGNSLGAMPVPTAKSAVINTRPGVFKL